MTLYITEFNSQGYDQRGNLAPVAQLPPIAEQTVATGGTSAQSAALTASTAIVRLHSDTTCSVAIGVNPTAATTGMRLYANSPEYFMVQPGQGYKIAVIANS